MASTTAPPNDRQQDVLNWIAEGCPSREWPNSTHKTTAIALQNRRLVKISRRGGWSAALTETGEYYRTHGSYPAEVSAPRRRSATRASASEVPKVGEQQPRARSSKQAAEPAHSTIATYVPDPEAPSDREGHEELASARKLVADVEAAGGNLSRDATGKKRYYSALVDTVNANQLAPLRQRLAVANTDNAGEVTFTFEAAPKWLSTWPRDVADADRIGRWHPVVASVRSEKRLSCTAEVKSRAMRILHTFATESDKRGHRTALPRRDNDRYGYRTYERGDIKITVREYTYTISIVQQHDTIAHVPTPQELEDKKRYSYTHVPKWDSIPNGKLGISIGLLEGRDFQQFKDNPKRGTVVEDLLPEAMQWLEQDADQRDAAKEAARERQIAEAERQREAARLAQIQHQENLNIEELRKQATRWAEARAIRFYLAALTDRIESIEDEEKRAAAAEWLAWGKGVVERLDPLSGIPGPPRNRYMTWQEQMDLTSAARASMP